jgi:hypothetical protein
MRANLDMAEERSFIYMGQNTQMKRIEEELTK